MYILHVHHIALPSHPGVHYINYSIVQRTSTQTVSESPVWPFDHIQNILLISLFVPSQEKYFLKSAFMNLIFFESICMKYEVCTVWVLFYLQHQF